MYLYAKEERVAQHVCVVFSVKVKCRLKNVMSVCGHSQECVCVCVCVRECLVACGSDKHEIYCNGVGLWLRNVTLNLLERRQAGPVLGPGA